jgi:hypothetical protein
MMLRALQIIFFVLLLSRTPNSLLAQGGAISPTIGVSPTKVLESVTPGQEQKFKVRLRNYGRDPLPLAGSVQGISTIGESGVPTFTDKLTPHSASGWLEIENKDVIVEPGEQQEVIITAKPPQSLAPGSYHAAIIFQAKLPSYYFDLDSDTRVLPAISVLFFLTVESDKLPTVEDLKITALQVPRVVVSTPLSVTAQIQNPSNFYIQADAKTTISGGINRKNGSEEIGRLILLPDGVRKLVSAYSDRLLPGVYTASVELKQGDKVLIASAKFIALPWQFTLGLLIATLAILFFAFRRRFKHAYRVLIGKEPLNPPRQRQPIIR